MLRVTNIIAIDITSHSHYAYLLLSLSTPFLHGSLSASVTALIYAE